MELTIGLERAAKRSFDAFSSLFKIPYSCLRLVDGGLGVDPEILAQLSPRDVQDLEGVLKLANYYFPYYRELYEPSGVLLGSPINVGQYWPSDLEAKWPLGQFDYSSSPKTQLDGSMKLPKPPTNINVTYTPNPELDTKSELLKPTKRESFSAVAVQAVPFVTIGAIITLLVLLF